MHVVVANLYVDDERIIIGVVKTSGIFFREPNDRVDDPWHLRYGTCQLDVVNLPEVSFASLLGQPSGRCTPYNHSYISYGWSKAFVFSSRSLFLWWIHFLLADKPLQLSLSDKGFNLLLQVVAVSDVMAVILMEATIFVLGPFVRISFQLTGKI